jgi:hypothetical protein
MDNDLETLPREQLIAEIETLRAAINAPRSSEDFSE